MFGFHKPRQAEDRHWNRLMELQADLEQVKAAQRTLSGEWSEVLARVNKAVQRLERAQERADARSAPKSEPLGSPVTAPEGFRAPEGQGFAAKLARINGRGVK